VTERRSARAQTRLCTFLFVLVALAPVVAQRPDFRVSSRDLVVLPVTVIDKDGLFVPDLAAERFAVFDNGRSRPIAFFSSEDTPVTIGLLIDTSSSMRAKLGEVVAAAVAFARSSNPQDELFVLSFNESVRDALPEHRFLPAADVGRLQTAVASLRPEGRTALYDGLLAALDRLDSGKLGRKALVVISDGGDNVSRATLADVQARAQRSSAVIFTIGLFDADDPDRNPGVLESLARATGGERFLPRSAGPLLQACERIARAIRSGYTMAIEPPERDGSYHKIRVQVSEPDRRLSARTRDGYVASRGVNGDTP